MGDSYVAGVGNEVIYCCGAFVALIAGLLTINRYLPSQTVSSQDSSQQRPDRTYDNDICPICLGPHRLAVETNCGHKFCGTCIKNYVENRAPREFFFASGNLACPLCRQSINLLLLSFENEDSAADADERQEIETIVSEYNIRFGRGPRSWVSYVRDCPVLIRHLAADFFSFEGVAWMFRLRVLSCFTVAIMYLLMPLDIVPESLFGFFGLFDDIIVVFLCAIYLSIIYRRFLLNRTNEGDT